MIYYLLVEGILAQPLTETGCSQDGNAWHSPFAKVELMRPDALNLIYRIEKKYPVFIPLQLEACIPKHNMKKDPSGNSKIHTNERL